MTDPATFEEAAALVADYAYTLDEGRLEEWPRFFTDPCLYRITTREMFRQGRPLSIMVCDNQAMLYDRVEAIERVNIFEPHHYRHVLSRSKPLELRPDCLCLQTGFICVRTMADGAQSLFASGEYRDEIARGSARCLLRARTVILDSSRIDNLLAIPL
jgi:anthranilate 1,2-dioxygenase small subunit